MVIYGYLLVIFWLSLVSIDLLGLVIYGYLWLSLVIYGYRYKNILFNTVIYGYLTVILRLSFSYFYFLFNKQSYFLAFGTRSQVFLASYLD